jgi:hypothetical protein
MALRILSLKKGLQNVVRNLEHRRAEEKYEDDE